MTLVNLIPHPDKSTLQWMNLPTFLVLCSPYLIPATSLSSELTALLSEAGTALHKLLLFSWNAAARIKARRHQHHHTTGLQNRKSPEKKNQVNWTERYRAYIQTLLFWDGIHLCNRGGFSKPCCVLRSAVRLTRRDYCHLHHNHVVGLVLRTKTSTHSREKGGGRRGEGAREHTKEPMQTNNQSPPHLW